MDDTTVIQ